MRLTTPKQSSSVPKDAQKNARSSTNWLMSPSRAQAIAIMGLVEGFVLCTTRNRRRERPRRRARGMKSAEAIRELVSIPRTLFPN